MNIRKIIHYTFIILLTTSFCMQQSHAGPYTTPSGKNGRAEQPQSGTTSATPSQGSGELPQLFGRKGPQQILQGLFFNTKEDKKDFLTFTIQDYTTTGLTTILHILTEFFNITSLGSTSPATIKNTALASSLSNGGTILQSMIINGVGFKKEFTLGRTAILSSIFLASLHGYLGLKNIKKLKNAATLADFYKKNLQAQKDILYKKNMFMFLLALSSILELYGTIGIISSLNEEKKQAELEFKIHKLLLPHIAHALGLIIKYINTFMCYQVEDKMLAKATALSNQAESIDEDESIDEGEDEEDDE